VIVPCIVEQRQQVEKRLASTRFIGYTKKRGIATSQKMQRNQVFSVKITEIPGKKRGRYIPKYYVFRGFHLSTCYP